MVRVGGSFSAALCPPHIGHVPHTATRAAPDSATKKPD